MITTEQIIEAARAAGMVAAKYDTPPFITFGLTSEDLIKFAQHFYRQGLLDAADKCDATKLIDTPTIVETAAISKCNKAIRQMAEEIK
jgi:hypothetical protein